MFHRLLVVFSSKGDCKGNRFMSAQNEHPENGNATDASPQSEDSAATIQKVLQDFDVLPSKLERHIFKYGYLYFIGFYFLFVLQSIIHLILLNASNQLVVGNVIGSKNLLLIVVGICLILWSFNAWRGSVLITLQAIYEKKYLTKTKYAGNVTTQYLELLKHYAASLRSPRRYLLIGTLVISVAVYYIYENTSPILLLTSQQKIVEIFFTILYLLFIAFIYFGFIYCIGASLWALYQSGQFIRILSRDFEFKIDPAHPDKCGGLKKLGNFCFGSTAPILIGSAYFIGYIFVVLRDPTGAFDLISAAYTLFVILLYGIPITIFTFFVPLWSIHRTMRSERETYENNHAASIAAMREQIQELLDDNQLDQAKTVQEKMKLMKTLYIPYPTWPFNFRTKTLSFFFGAVGSLLLGVLTSLEPILVLVIQQHISQKP
jgi:hypothetical protein